MEIKSRPLARTVKTIHMVWLFALCFSPVCLADTGLKFHMWDVLTIQVITSWYWKFNCPLSSLEDALKAGDPINKNWIIQPIVTVMAVPIIVELIVQMRAT